MTKAQSQRFRVNATVSASMMPDGAVLMDNATGECFELNRMGARVWQCLARGDEIDDLIDAIASEHSVERSIVSADTLALVDELARRGILLATP